MRNEIVFAGFGGQGIVLMGVLAAAAAGMHDGKCVAQTQSYGPASRGGACRSDVIISEHEIDYAKALNPTVMVLMSQAAADKYTKEAGPDCTIICDSSLIKAAPQGFAKTYMIPATDITEKEIGNKIIANVFMLSAAAAITGLMSKEGIKQAVLSSVREKHREINNVAIEAGYKYGSQMLQQNALS